MSKCRYCGDLPSLEPKTGRLFVSAPTISVEQKLISWVALQGGIAETSSIGLLNFAVNPTFVSDLCRIVPKLLNPESMAEIRLALHAKDQRELTHREILRMEPINRFIGRVGADWLIKYLQKGALEHAFHPMVNPRTGRIEAYECLMRAVMPDGQVKSPAELISTARAADILLQLDRIARVSAISNAARKGIAQNIFINFNPSAKCDPEVCLQSTVAEAAQYGIDPAKIVFEVTESECVTDLAHLRKVLDFYRSQGFRIALDDLGSGYSSLNLLTELRPDYVKLDMALIRGIHRDPYKQHVTRSLLEMAHHLKVKTVVEGVETEGEWAWATSHGAHMIQGYYFAKPAFQPPMGPDLSTWSHEAGIRRSA